MMSPLLFWALAIPAGAAICALLLWAGVLQEAVRINGQYQDLQCDACGDEWSPLDNEVLCPACARRAGSQIRCHHRPGARASRSGSCYRGAR